MFVKGKGNEDSLEENKLIVVFVGGLDFVIFLVGLLLVYFL